MTKVFYRPEMSVNTRSFSPSADKPRLAVEDWLTHPDLAHCRPTIMSFSPLDRYALEDAHSPEYIEDVFSGERSNGFGNRDPAVAEACLYTTASMLAAARWAWENKTNTCSPTSGFHHAGRNFGGGFCTFNGLAIATLRLLIGPENCRRRILILDLDQHAGNGTSDILLCVKTQCHGKYNTVRHFSAGEHRLRDWLDVRQFIYDAFDSDYHEIILFQAGADMHINDPLGGLLDTEEMKARDELVFRLAAKRRIPVAWNLAGGYQTDEDGSIAPVLAIHRNTYLACVNESKLEEPSGSDSATA